MTLCTIGALATIVLVGVQIVLPGKALYHYGWYNVAIAGFAVAAVVAARRPLRVARSRSIRAAVVSAVFGAGIAAVAGIASGLFGPEDQQVIGSPGQRVSVEGLGTLIFPLVVATGGDAGVQLARPLHATVEISTRSRNLGNFVARSVTRTVVEVEARDFTGGRLTITQPTGRSFLSPVLLMEHRQAIAGFDLPFDSFNVPAAHRIVKAVLFSAAEAAMLQRGTTAPAVLFAIDDENDRPLPHAIGFAASGRSIRIAGLELRAVIAGFPAIEVVSAPNVAATILGALLAVAATAVIVLRRRRARYG